MHATPHKPHLPHSDTPQDPEPGAMPVEPDAGAPQPIIPEAPGGGTPQPMP